MATTTKAPKHHTRTADRAPELCPSCGPEEAFACLLEITQELNASADLATGLERVAARLREYVVYDTMAVLLLDDLGRELRFALAVGYPPQVQEHWRFGMGQGIVGTAAESGRPVRVDDVRSDLRYINACPDTRSELAVPLRVDGRTVGVLDVGSYKPASFNAEHERLLSFLGRHLATAIENARLVQNLTAQAQTLSLIHEVGRQLTSILDRKELLERVGEQIRRLIAYDLFGVMLWDEERQLLEPLISLTSDDRAVADTRSLPLGVGLCGTAAALRQSLRVPNVHLDPRYVTCVSGLPVASELVVPLLFEDRLVGVVVLDSVEYDAFTPRHEQILSTLASTIAIALENARLYEQVRQGEERLAADLSMAREIQKQLLPKESPWIEGVEIGAAYSPARHLAGDFYEFLPYGDGRTALALGDVAGKGSSAALYGSLAVGTLREYAVRHLFEPPRVLADMNSKLRDLGISNRFLAMAFAVYDARARKMVLANAGLPRPFLLRAGEATGIDVVGTPLGLLPDRSYEAVELTLGKGDSVVLCSDGIEEFHSPRGEEFGEARVREALAELNGASAGEIAQALLDATDRFAGNGDAYDDRTVVVLRAAS